MVGKPDISALYRGVTTAKQYLTRPMLASARLAAKDEAWDKVVDTVAQLDKEMDDLLKSILETAPELTDYRDPYDV